jgi:uridine kinase
MLIHILGPSGSGKTTLGLKLEKVSKNVLVIDTDSIDDPNTLKYNTNAEIARHNKNDLNNILNKNKDKIIIIVGFLHSGLNYLNNLFTHKFYILIDPISLWKQYNLRTINEIYNNYSSLTKLIKNADENGIDNFYIMLSKKYKIRNGFMCNNLNDFTLKIKANIKKNKKLNYTCMTRDKIYSEIVTLIKKGGPMDRDGPRDRRFHESMKA